MFSRLVAVSMVALATVALAGKCNTGDVQCCNSVENSDSAVASAILKTLGLNLQDTTAKIGLGCSPLSVISVGGSTCKAETVCCENNNVGGGISIGCVPVSL